MALISIIIPLYNKEKHIKNTLMSVLSQTCEDFEIIVVNDGSTDKSEIEVKAINDKRIKLYTTKNQGVSNARNYGVGYANSNLIVFLDSDDVWKPNHLEILNNLYEKFPDCGMYAAAYEYNFHPKTFATEYYSIPKTTNWFGVIDDFFKCSTINCIASSSSVMIPKKVCEDLGGFNPNFTSGEDTDFWIRIALKYRVAFTNSVSVMINKSAQNQVTKTSIDTRKHPDFDQFKKEEQTNQNLKKYLDLNRFSIAIQYILIGNQLKAQEFINKIDLNNLNQKQRFLLRMNTPLLKTFMGIKTVLRNNGITLSAFR